MNESNKANTKSSEPVALITGASFGIGLELAKEAAKDGHHVILVARTVAKLESLAQKLTTDYGVSTTVIEQDLTIPGAAEELFVKVKAEGLSVDLLFNNAGNGVYGSFLDINAADDHNMLQLNMIALTDMCRVFGRDMVARKEGRIVNVASTAAFQPGPFFSTYYATKAYVLSLSEALNSELRDHGVSVTAICPGPTKSSFQEKAAMTSSRLMKLGFMDAKDVARIGYRGAKRRKSVVVTGLMNAVMAFSVRLMPRNVTTYLSRLASQPT